MIQCKCKNIKAFLGGEGENYAKEHLKKLTVNKALGMVLYLCPSTGKYWKKYFPHPQAHGDGPPDFTQISEEEARKEFLF